MKNSVDITRGYQILYMLRRTIFAAFVSMVVQIVVFINFLDVELMRTIIGCVMMFVYAAVLYTGAATLGKFDQKPYTSLKVQHWRPLIWGGIIAVISIAFLILYKMNWQSMSNSGELPSILSVVVNAVFYIWNSPYISFILGNTNGYIPPVLEVAMVVLPIVACFLGYFAGSKNLFVLDKANDFMFEKTDSEE